MSEQIERAARVLTEALFKRSPYLSADQNDASKSDLYAQLRDSWVPTLAAAGLLIPSDGFASTKPSDADVDLLRRAAASERTAERHWPADMLAQAADTIERLRTDLAANPDADVAERIAREIKAAGTAIETAQREVHRGYLPIIESGIVAGYSQAARIAHSHATPPVAATGEGDGR